MQKKLLEMGIGPITPYPRDANIAELFEEIVGKHGSKIALRDAEGSMTYRELNEKANQIGHHLQRLGVNKGDFVGISLDRSLNLVAGVLGILKAGAVYVPIDQAYPMERKKMMIEDAELKVLITQQTFWNQFPHDKLRLFCLDAEEFKEEKKGNLGVKVGPLDLAYINYTSGSTGKPKGVEVCHRGVIRHVVNSNYISILPNACMLNMANISFDATTTEIWGALLNGACLCIYPQQEFSPELIGAFLVKEKVTHALFTARLFNVLVESELSSLKGLGFIASVGEAMSVYHAKMAFKALPKCNVVNAYGPTENTACTTFYVVHDLKEIEHVVPIGRPISNTDVYILDPDQKPVEIGVVGEIYTGGDGVAKGYLNRPDLTAEKFVPNPFGNGLLYRTGDLARFLPDGNIVFDGRVDAQVKIRGFRIELGEIEEVFRHHSCVADCATLAREDTPGDKRLVAYIELRKGKKISSDELIEYAASKLPSHMVPHLFVILNKFPLSPTGKVDRKSLPPPVIGIKEKAVYKTPVEKEIARIWAEVLHLDHVSPHDHFIKIGGDSIHAMQLITRLKKELRIEASVDILFEHPVLTDFAAQVEKQKKRRPKEQIPKRTTQSPIPLSLNQESMWLVDQLMPGSTAYSLLFPFRLKGEVNIHFLEQALEMVVKRHEALRTCFMEKDERSYQVIHENVKANFHRSDRPTDGMALLEKKAAIPFDLKRTPLFQFDLIQVAANEYLCMFNVHHIVFDGWASKIFFKEWSLCYESLLKKQPIRLPKVQLQDGDYSLWQREFLKSEEAKKQLNYWKKKLSAAPVFTELPTDKPRPPTYVGNGASRQLHFSNAFSKSLAKAAQSYGVTLFSFLLAAFKVLLYRYCGKEDVLVGTTYANRERHELESMIGFLAQILIIRSDLTGNPTFSELMQQVSKNVADACNHSDIPFEVLVAELNPMRSRSYNAYIQVGFALEIAIQRMIYLEGVEAKWFNVENKSAGIDLYLAVQEEEDHFLCHLQYCTDLYESDTIDRILKNYQTLLSGFLEDPDQRIDQIPILTPDEIHQITVEWNETETPYPKDQSVCPLFEEVVEQYPENEALRFRGKAMTYRELNKQANQLAHYLQKLGLKKSDFVGIYLERSIDLFVGILAILKAGGVYVPIDASYPLERKLFMIEDANLKVLLTQRSFAKEFPQDKIQLLCLDDEKSLYTRLKETNLRLRVGPLDLAYINYTSGSTGRPKGVEVAHQGIVRLVRNINWNNIATDDRFLQISNISFDALTHELWGALLNGAALSIFPQMDLSPKELGKFIAEEKVTQILFTARLFTLMVEEELDLLKGVRCLCSCGDVMSSRHAKLAFETLKNCVVKNTCGHTENTTHTLTYTIYDAKAIENGVPVGTPISNTRIYILDKNAQPLPIGVPGELYIGGDGVAAGYLNRPELTEEKFVPDPFSKNPNDRLYRAGDLVRYLPDGNVAYMGRIDNQVKIRGFRIELGEIEEVVRGYKKTADCVALVREDVPGDKRLVAYVEPKEGEKITSEEINEFVKSKVPQYMLPSFFLILEKFPITPNGKLDRKALPSPNEALGIRTSESPQTTTEKILADMWSSLLNIQKIGRQDNFFNIGGHSIAAAQLASLASKAFATTIPVSVIFEDSTLEKYAKRIDQMISQGAAGEKTSVTSRELFWIWRNRESILDPSIGINGSIPIHHDQYKYPRNIFVTGTTGFVGAFFLAELLEETKAKVYCHVRAKTEQEATARLCKVLENYLIWKPEYASRIIAVPGDLEKELLGIAPDQFDDLSNKIDSIYHFGAFVNHALPYQRLKASNVLGTQEAIRLASKIRVKPFHFISTLGILAVQPIKGRPIEEDLDIQECKNLVNGYAQSKWVGEKLVHIARSRGIPANIYRLARASGDSRVGSGPTGDFLWRVMVACLKMELAPEINYREDVTPVDYVCKAIRIISSQQELINRQYNVLNPQPYYYRDIFNLFKKLGYQLEMTDFDRWVKVLVHRAIQSGESELKALTPLLSEYDLSKVSEDYCFSNSHVTKALEGSGITCPKVDEKLFKKYIDYYVKIGFLPPYG